MSEIKDGGPGALPPVKVNVPCDEFENAIRAIGVVAACEYFGYGANSEFTETTIAYLRARGAT